MRYYRTVGADGPRLVARRGADAYDLTAARPNVTAFEDLAYVANVSDRTVDEVTGDLLDETETIPVPDEEAVGIPTLVDEVWAAGVTYEISEQAREAESGMPEMYLDVYGAERPEVFFKATWDRVVAPGEAVGVRSDSEWNVPEPELGIVLYEGDIVGYTAGNDVSSRSIEGENPLYLPQAKVYDRCCSLGPCVATPEAVGDPHDLAMTMTVERDGETVYEGETSTGKMVRTCEELVSYLSRHNSVPESAVLLTGTSLVPEEGFTLTPADEVHIDIESVGHLANDVTTV
ncbi:fumarylacetoacetate hydrolase family protein [Halorubrum lacusprofundi]|jgi:2-dehydro-3-deoxy-D-arabinonate dehydratase|uniref:fumarylacetoacetate hydrolase family protein n=1 Tax=Halorubrum lacusprofundi TaxID=2247 RepID=UPI000B5A8FC5|nr:fumarylacetoacetate hydrolase family protein [Halorubrum lacusprofundi]MCG1007575.1 fumarylacetoacetate hydrolase family protein [Halorubrum lacusprofundi]